jgi:hypothetical protein
MTHGVMQFPRIVEQKIGEQQCPGEIERRPRAISGRLPVPLEI